MLTYRNPTNSPVLLPIPLKPAVLNKPLNDLLKLKKDVKIHTIQPGQLVAFDEQEMNGPRIVQLCEDVAMVHVPNPFTP